MSEKPPKMGEVINIEEAALRKVFLIMDYGIFDNLQRKNPEEAERLRSDFESYVKIQREAMKDMGAPRPTLQDLKKKYPNNLWIEYLLSVMLQKTK